VKYVILSALDAATQGSAAMLVRVTMIFGVPTALSAPSYKTSSETTAHHLIEKKRVAD
jgi:hypothetical protein